ncbi:VCBS repeat-containing protein [Streptomyces sp. SDr-06]|uniref:FG-GAP repeat domain-containing protein n=1 Tax=Streptomyces sp. SDr-06 TaxID=2267702 RepID=UPI000DEB6500|nr:VCBS repeat-containing protein [Streptomyces sp. SDr-06]RCH65183.1 VCBS repeat-containing protein [Streptomyces sp. SDr-06]
MAILSGRKGGRALSRIAVAAIAAALVGTTAGAASADSTPAPAAATAAQKVAQAKGKQSPSAQKRAFAAGSETPAAETFPLTAADGSGTVYMYPPNGSGGFGDRQALGNGWNVISQATQVDNNKDGVADAWYTLGTNGHLYFAPLEENSVVKDLGGGWNAYDRVFSPGDLGGAPADDLLARDKSGVLWLYTAKGDGSFTPPVKLGAGWGVMTKIAGRGDMNGDGKADIIAVDNAGTGWLYPGTGNWAAPFGNRVKLGGGWNTYNTLVGLGDLNFDGKADLIGRDADGGLWFYPGTGTTNGAPFKDRVKVGTGWNGMRLMF